MKRTEYLLVKLAEECMEVGQRATKALAFGLTEVQPGQSFTNAERISQEVGDLISVLEMLRPEVPAPAQEAIETHKAQVAHYMEYSVGCGTLEQ